MSNYYLILIWIVIFCMLEMLVQTKRMEMVGRHNVVRTRPFWALVLVAPLVIWTANRGYVIDSLLSS